MQGRIEPGPGQESVWDYPRPPRLERTPRRIRAQFAGVSIVDTTDAWRILETYHPPVYYVPREAVADGVLRPTPKTTVCEFKGVAGYFDLVVGEQVARNAAWSYEHPNPGYEPIAGHVAFYAAPLDAAWVDDEQATPQPGHFYGGWITDDVVGPFKGEPGTWGW
jgi:uncharacterized protein (DUF427 family)